MMVSEEQNRAWKNNLLLYLETCMVDHGGLFRWNKIGDDEKFLDEFKEEGLIGYVRLSFKEIEKMRYSLGPAGPFTHIITKFSEEAWTKATELRRARAARLSAKYTERRTES